MRMGWMELKTLDGADQGVVARERSLLYVKSGRWRSGEELHSATGDLSYRSSPMSCQRRKSVALPLCP